MSYAQNVMEGLKQKYASEPVFLQAVQEVLMTLQPALDKDPKYQKNKILERIVERSAPSASEWSGWTTRARSRSTAATASTLR